MRKILDYLDKEGLRYLVAKIKEELNGKVSKESNKGLSSNDFTNEEKEKLRTIAANANNYSLPTASATTLGGIKVGSNLTINNGILAAKDTTYTEATAKAAGLLSVSGFNKLNKVTESEMGFLSGVTSSIQSQLDNRATLDSNKKVTSTQLPFGTTNTTVFRGDYGETAYNHANAKGSAFAEGLYKITTNAQGHVTGAKAVTKEDIVALGIPAQDTNTTYKLATSTEDGLLSKSDFTKLSKVTADEMSYLSGATSNIQEQIDTKTREVIYIPEGFLPTTAGQIVHEAQEWADLWFGTKEHTYQDFLDILEKMYQGNVEIVYKASNSTRVFPVAYCVGKTITASNGVISYKQIYFIVHGLGKIYIHRFLGVFRNNSTTKNIILSTEVCSEKEQFESEYYDEEITTKPKFYNEVTNDNYYDQDSFILYRSSINAGRLQFDDTKSTLVIRIKNSCPSLYFSSTSIKKNLTQPFTAVGVSDGNLRSITSITPAEEVLGVYKITGNFSENSLVMFEFDVTNEDCITNFTLRKLPVTSLLSKGSPTIYENSVSRITNETQKLNFTNVRVTTSSMKPTTGEDIWIRKGAANIFTPDKVIDNKRCTTTGVVEDSSYFTFKIALSPNSFYYVNSSEFDGCFMMANSSNTAFNELTTQYGYIYSPDNGTCYLNFRKLEGVDLQQQLDDIVVAQNSANVSALASTKLYLKDDLGNYFLAADFGDLDKIKNKNLATTEYVDEKVSGGVDFNKIYTLSWSNTSPGGYIMPIDGLTDLEEIRDKQIAFKTTMSNSWWVTSYGISLSDTPYGTADSNPSNLYMKVSKESTVVGQGIHFLTYTNVDGTDMFVIDNGMQMVRFPLNFITSSTTTYSSQYSLLSALDFSTGSQLLHAVTRATSGALPVYFHNVDRGDSACGSCIATTVYNTSRYISGVKSLKFTVLYNNKIYNVDVQIATDGASATCTRTVTEMSGTDPTLEATLDQLEKANQLSTIRASASSAYTQYLNAGSSNNPSKTVMTGIISDLQQSAIQINDELRAGLDTFKDSAYTWGLGNAVLTKSVNVARNTVYTNALSYWPNAVKNGTVNTSQLLSNITTSNANVIETCNKIVNYFRKDYFLVVPDTSTFNSSDTYKFSNDTTNGYYKSGNATVVNSFSRMRFYIYVRPGYTATASFGVNCYSESNYDYGIVGNLDQALNANYAVDSTYNQLVKSSDSNFTTITYTIPEGSHYIDFKYRKDSSGNQNNDEFRVKLTNILTNKNS